MNRIVLLGLGCVILLYLLRYPGAKVTVKVVDENGKPVSGATVRLGFERYNNGQYRPDLVTGTTNSAGKFSGSGRGNSYLGISAEKDGFYKTYSEFRFTKVMARFWRPYNPEVVTVLRPIRLPVPMYARSLFSDPIVIPEIGVDVGYDLIESDWVRPYGRGNTADFVFKVEKTYLNDVNFNSSLTLSFSNADDGIMNFKEPMRIGSMYRLPRYAPESGYQKKLVHFLRRQPGQPMERSSDEANSYVFRVRSKRKDGKLVKAMYGKIRGDLQFDPSGMETAMIQFRYYLNPDHSRNLEFDPRRNLFVNLPSMSTVSAP